MILPSDMPGLRLWLDGGDQATVTRDGSNKVSQWNDKGPSALNATQVTAAIQPVYDPKGLVGSPAAEGKMNLPGVNGLLSWFLAVARFNPSQRAGSDGTLVAINGYSGSTNQRTPMLGYNLSGAGLTFEWRTAGSVTTSLAFAQGTDFASNAYFSILGYIDGGVLKASVNGAAAKTAGSGLTIQSSGVTGLLGDFRAGWTESGLRSVACGTDTLTADQITGLMAYGAQQAAIANAP